MRTFVAACLIFALLPSVATLNAQPGHPGQAAPEVLSRVTKVHGLRLAATQAPMDADCCTFINIPCYSPQEIQKCVRPGAYPECGLYRRRRDDYHHSFVWQPDHRPRFADL